MDVQDRIFRLVILKEAEGGGPGLILMSPDKRSKRVKRKWVFLQQGEHNPKTTNLFLVRKAAGMEFKEAETEEFGIGW